MYSREGKDWLVLSTCARTTNLFCFFGHGTAATQRARKPQAGLEENIGVSELRSMRRVFTIKNTQSQCSDRPIVCGFLEQFKHLHKAQGQSTVNPQASEFRVHFHYSEGRISQVSTAKFDYLKENFTFGM
jgi:hypothetical protein